MRLRVRLTIPDPMPDDAGSRVRAAVVDTSRADALHPAVAEATTSLERASALVEIDLQVPDAALVQGRRYSLQAHVDRGGTGDIEPGDLIITEDVPVAVGAGAGPHRIDATLRRV